MSLLEGLQSSQIFFISFCTLFGLMVGSFLNVVIYRLPKMLERRWRRQSLSDLIDNPRTLNDIGLTRDDVLREINKPFWR